MEAIDGCRKSVFIYVGVDLCRADAGVAEKLLNDAQVGPTRKQVGGKGVAKKVGVDACIEAGGLGRSFYDSPKVRCGQAPAMVSKKDLTP
jgi:hypothetical protein